MKTVALGSQGLKVSQQGFGCMGLTTAYGRKLPNEEIDKILQSAYDQGVTFWDTANLYAYPDYFRLLQFRSPVVCQEEIIAETLHKIGRENITMATKTGIKLSMFPTFKFAACGDRQFIREQCEASLKRLKTDYLDVFYLHRIDQTLPIEISMLEMKKLHKEGKIKYVGLSECSAKTIRRAHKIHPLSVIQMEYSLWARGIEHDVMEACNELGIGVVSYSPLGRGFLSSDLLKKLTKKEDGSLDVGKLEKGDFRAGQPMFNENNLKLVQNVEKIAQDKGISLAQLALAWVLNQQHRMSGDNSIVPIPGTTKIKNLQSNVGACDIELTEDDLRLLEEAVPADKVEGDRYDDSATASIQVWEKENNPEMTEEQARAVEAELQTYQSEN